MARTATIEAMILERRDRSMQITTSGDVDDAVWIPTKCVRSCEILHVDQEIYELEVDEWLARKEGLI